MKMLICLLFSSLALMPGAASADESWAVCVYLEKNGTPMHNEVFFETSTKDAQEAASKVFASCEQYAEKRGAKKGRYECKAAGLCSEPGWFAIASSVKSMGTVGVSCKAHDEETAVSSAKTTCGSLICSKILAHEIKKAKKTNGRKKSA